MNKSILITATLLVQIFILVSKASATDIVDSSLSIKDIVNTRWIGYYASMGDSLKINAPDLLGAVSWELTLDGTGPNLPHETMKGSNIIVQPAVGRSGKANVLLQIGNAFDGYTTVLTLRVEKVRDAKQVVLVDTEEGMPLTQEGQPQVQNIPNSK